jgi:DNA-binding response OmpR family regulator
MTFLKKILLLHHDSKATAPVLGALAQTGEYTIRQERDAQLACKAVRWFQPDLILCDGTMSRGQAAAVTRQLQGTDACRETPVMFVSADDNAESVVISSGILSGYSFFARPVGLDEFVRCVAEILRPGSKVRAAIKASPSA